MKDTHKRPHDAGDDEPVPQPPAEPLPTRMNELEIARDIGRMIGRWAVEDLREEQQAK